MFVAGYKARLYCGGAAERGESLCPFQRRFRTHVNGCTESRERSWLPVSQCVSAVRVWTVAVAGERTECLGYLYFVAVDGAGLNVGGAGESGEGTADASISTRLTRTNAKING